MTRRTASSIKARRPLVAYPTEYHVPDLPATQWGTCSCGLAKCRVCEPTVSLPRPAKRSSHMPTALLVVGLIIGHVSANLRHRFDTWRISGLEKSMELCDSEVLKAQKALDDAREAFWKAGKP